MRNVVIDQKDCRLGFERQLLLITHSSFRKPISLPFNQIQSLTIVTAVDISSNLLTKLAEYQIAVNIIPSGQSGSACRLQGEWHKAVTRRQIQYEVLRDIEYSERWARVVVKLKIYRHAKLLQRLSRQITVTDNQAVQLAIGNLRQSSRRLKTYFLRQNCTLVAPHQDLATLRGVEGAAAAMFFAHYRHFFDSGWQFTERNRRPPKDPVNTLLSLAYTLLQGVCEQAIFAVGFDPFLGVLHEVSYGRQSLACDFAELQRDEIEFFVWQLLHDGTISLNDFNMDDNKASARPCELLKSGRSQFYQAFTKLKPRLQRQAREHVWIWLHRLERQCTITGEEAVLQATLDHISESDF